MSSFLSRILSSIGLIKRKATIVVVGLDNSGKTTMLQWLKQQRGSITPTVGFNVEQFTRDNTHYTAFDMSGQERYRSLWEHYYSDANGVVFVVDSSDRTRGVVARDELEQMLAHKDLAGVPILIFANKCDINDAMTPAECSDALGLETIKNQPWHISGCCAITGQGMADGFEWLAGAISSARK